MQFLLDPGFQVLAAGFARGADPAPFLHQEFAVLPVGFQIDGGDDLLAGQHRQGKIAELALLLWHIGFETVAVVEEQFGALALDHQRIERRENVHQFGCRGASVFQRLGTRPVLLLAGILEPDRHQFPGPYPRLDQAPDRGLARCIEMTDRIEAQPYSYSQRLQEGAYGIRINTSNLIYS